MKPSVLSTSSTWARSFEPGVETFVFLRIWALRMRANRSPSGSFNAMRSSSPARLHETGDHALGAELPERDTAHLQLAVIGARAPGDLAAIANAHFGGIARQLRKL